MFCILCSLFCIGQNKPKNDSIVIRSDSLLNSFTITSYHNGCFLREKEYRNNQLIEDIYFSINRDTLIKYFYYDDGKFAGKHVFLIKDQKEKCLKYLDEGLYNYYEIMQQEYNIKGVLIDEQIYELKYSKKEGREISCITEQFMFDNKGKLTDHFKWSYDEDLNSTKVKLK